MLYPSGIFEHHLGCAYLSNNLQVLSHPWSQWVNEDAATGNTQICRISSKTGNKIISELSSEEYEEI